MLGQVKRWAYDLLLDSPFPDAPEAQAFLVGYFPRRLQAEFASSMPEHTLRREIVATVAVNHVINHAGVSFLYRMMGESGETIDRVVSTYVAVEGKAEASALRARIMAADLSAEAETAALLELEDALESMASAALEGGAAPEPAETLRPVLALLEKR